MSTKGMSWKEFQEFARNGEEMKVRVKAGQTALEVMAKTEPGLNWYVCHPANAWLKAGMVRMMEAWEKVRKQLGGTVGAFVWSDTLHCGFCQLGLEALIPSPRKAVEGEPEWILEFGTERAMAGFFPDLTAPVSEREVVGFAGI